MIKTKLSQFLKWFKDHCLFLLEVVVRLCVGIRNENKLTTHKDTDEDKVSRDDNKEE